MLPKTILRGYDRATEKVIARALGISLPKRKGGEHRHMKIPMGVLKKESKADTKKPKKPGMKFGKLKGKQDEPDGDEPGAKA